MFLDYHVYCIDTPTLFFFYLLEFLLVVFLNDYLISLIAFLCFGMSMLIQFIDPQLSVEFVCHSLCFLWNCIHLVTPKL